MRWMRSVAAVGLLVGLAVLVPSSPACACDCAIVTAEEAVANADVVFAGTVEAVDPPWRGLVVSSANPVTVTFEVSTVYKGEAPVNAQVQTARDGVSCGYDFSPGNRYLVHAWLDQDGTWTTNSCNGNQLLSADTVLPTSGYAPAPAVIRAGESPAPVFIVSAAAAVAGVAAVIVLVLVLRSRRRGRRATKAQE